MKTILLLAAAAAAPAFAGIITPINNSFETPHYDPGSFTPGYVVTHTEGGWTFTSAGIAGPSSPWFAGSAPDGTQAAFCQNACSISQSVSGFVIGDPYSVSFYFADRPGYPPDSIRVTLGGVNLGTYTPENGNTAFVPVTTTTSMNATASTMTLMFTGLNTGSDNDTALDLVTIKGNVASVPEPSSVAGLLAAGVLGWLARRRAAR